MKDVFISYKAEEFDDANWVKKTLENNGISCWMAPTNIPGGSSYAIEIPQAIRECKVFVLILSKQTQLSKWVPKEIDQAINNNKTIMPFMLENCSLQDDFNFYLTNVQRYAAYESKSAAIKKMINEIRAIIEADSEFSQSESSVADSASENNGIESSSNYTDIFQSEKSSDNINKKQITFLLAIKKFFLNYMNFSGRASRPEFWFATLFSWFLLIVFYFLGLTWLLGLTVLAFTVPNLSLSIRRLHDIGKPWYYLLFGFIPFAGLVIMIVFFCQKSTINNQWGMKL